MRVKCSCTRGVAPMLMLSTRGVEGGEKTTVRELIEGDLQDLFLDRLQHSAAGAPSRLMPAEKRAEAWQAVVWGCTGTGRRVWGGAGGPKVARSVPCRVGRASA